MYHHAPPILAAADFPQIKAPLLGGEMIAKLSPKSSILLGVLLITGANTCSWTPDASAAVQLSATPLDVIVMADNSIDDAGATDIVFTVAGTDSASASFTTGSASFALPTWAQNATRTYNRCYSVDMVITSGLQIKTITGVTVACAAGATNGRFKVYALPALSTFSQIGVVDEKDFGIRTQSAVAIPVGLDESGFVKPGNIKAGSLSLTAKTQNDLDGLARYAGRPVTVLLETNRVNRLVTERYFFLRTTFGLERRAPMDASPVTETVTGIAEETPYLLAPTS